MAVTITVAQLASAIRVGSTAEETAEVTRLLAYATEAISNHLGDAFADTPDVVVNEAAVRLVGYLYDSPHASARDSFAFALRNSGAGRMLAPYQVHRLGTTGEAAAAAAATAGVDRAAVEEIIRELVNPTALAGDATRWGAAKLPMPPNTAEAAAGTSTTIRSWTAALIRHAINAVVPGWARIGDDTTLPVEKLPAGELNNPVPLGTSADFDTLTTPGVYDFSPGTTYTNGPPLTDENHGTLIVFLARDDNMRVMQMVWGRGASSFPALYARVQRTATLWSAWFDAFAQGTGGAIRITQSGAAPDEDTGDTGRTEVHFRRDAVDAIAQVYFSADGSTAWSLVYDLYAIAGERIAAQVEPWARLDTDDALQIRPWESEDPYSPRSVVHHNAGLWFAPSNVIAADNPPGGSARLWRMLATGDETVTISALSTTPHNVAARQVILWVPSAGADPVPAIILRDGRFTGRQLAASATELLHIIDAGGAPMLTRLAQITVTTAGTTQTFTTAERTAFLNGWTNGTYRAFQVRIVEQDGGTNVMRRHNAYDFPNDGSALLASPVVQENWQFVTSLSTSDRETILRLSATGLDIFRTIAFPANAVIELWGVA